MGTAALYRVCCLLRFAVFYGLQSSTCCFDLFFTFSAVVELFLVCFPLFARSVVSSNLNPRSGKNPKVTSQIFWWETSISQKTGLLGCTDAGNAKINLVRLPKKVATLSDFKKIAKKVTKLITKLLVR